jgi:hypothetical protein
METKLTAHRHRPVARLRVAGLLVALAGATGGCAVTTQPNGTTVCGVHFGTGAETLVGIPVDPQASPPAEAAPAASRLPAQRGDLSDAVLTGDEWVRTSPSCGTGATVSVDQTGNAGLDRVVRARDGGITLIILHVTAPVTVSSWIGGRLAGSLRLSPTGSSDRVNPPT